VEIHHINPQCYETSAANQSHTLTHQASTAASLESKQEQSHEKSKSVRVFNMFAGSPSCLLLQPNFDKGMAFSP
jgi:hypothetical protein